MSDFKIMLIQILVSLPLVFYHRSVIALVFIEFSVKVSEQRILSCKAERMYQKSRQNFADCN